MNILQKVLSVTMTAVSGLYRKHFLKNLTRAVEISNETLEKILRVNKDTEYGNRYGFSSISSKEEFKANVPLTTYEHYEDYISRMAKGEKNILICEDVKYFGVSSGTTGKQKLIPCTRSYLKKAALNMGLLSYGIIHHNLKSKWSYGRGLNLMEMAVTSVTEGGIPKSSGSSGGMRSMRSMIPYMWTSPVEMLECQEKLDSKYLHLLFALYEKELMYINSPFVSSILDLFRYLERNWESLTHSIKTGTIDKGINISENMRKVLQEKIRPDSLRATELREEFSKGFDDIVCRIWPKFNCIWSVAGATFKLYADKLKKYTGSLPVYSGLYAATESMVGICLGLNNPVYTVIPGVAYFEFIPCNDIDSLTPEALDIDQLVPGESYEVVITSFSGLYRYRMGDIVKVTGFHGKSPELEFLYRRNQLINIAAEKTSEQAAHSAVVETFRRLNEDFVDYSVMEDCDTSPGKYVFYVELKSKENTYRIFEFKSVLEEELCKSNPAYGRMRAADKIGHLDLKIVATGTYERLKTALLKSGVSANQLKIPRVIRTNEYADILNNNISKESDKTYTNF